MPECLIQTKGNIANPLLCLRNLEMPGETAEEDRFPSSSRLEEKLLGDVAKVDEKCVKEERSREEDRRDASSLLYTLAAAAASHSSLPNDSIKREIPPVSSDFTNRDGNSKSPYSTKKKISTASQDDSRLLTDGACHEILPVANDRGSEGSKDKFCSSKNDNNVPLKQTNQLHLMEAMMQRQRQLYEEYGHSNWMKMQRNDSNCLSKSKAKRYRWCVQKDQENEIGDNNQATVSNTTNQSPSLECSSSLFGKKKIPQRRGTLIAGPLHDKLYGTVFTGASKFRCRDCGKSFTTLVDLTVHMSKTGHYRDQNIAEIRECNDGSSNKFMKPKKRSVIELEEKESAEKVLKCLGCGHSFDSLQDLTVHMMKTKHYEDVPSLRLYSQKSEFCPEAQGNSISSSTDLKSSAESSQRFSIRNMSDCPSHVPTMDPPQQSSSFQETGNLTYHNNPAFASSFASQPNFANMLSMAALRLLGSFPPYFMQMPMQNPMTGYDMASAAYAAAAARLFLSSPWLGQVPAMGASAMFSPFLNSSASLQTAMPGMNVSGHRSPVSLDANLPSQPLSSSTPAAHVSSPEVTSTPNGSTQDGEDLQNCMMHVLRCIQCGESFSSLQKMTDHMRETTHFPIAMTPPSEDGTVWIGSRCSSSGESVFRSSPKEKASSGPTASPLEQLAKLASGKSLGEMNGSASARSKKDKEHFQNIPHSSESHGDLTIRSPLQSPSCSLSNDCYLRPTTPIRDSGGPLTGSDFIKSLESTIQSAISRVNQQPSSLPVEKIPQSSLVMENCRPQKSRKHHILQSFLPTTAKIHGKSSPIENFNSSFDLTRYKVRERPSSDCEEYFRNNNPQRIKNHSPKAKSTSALPPLDLCKSDNALHESPIKNICSGESKRSHENQSPVMSEDGMAFDSQAFLESNVRRRWEKKISKSKATTPPTKVRNEKFESPLPNHKDEEVYNKPESDPLKEMQKIVNATEISVQENYQVPSKQKHRVSGQKRKLENESQHIHETKSSKPNSILSDLVRHKDHDQSPSLSPLAQMEHLVNLKIGRGDASDIFLQSKKSYRTKSYFSRRKDTSVLESNCINPMSALLNIFQSGSSTLQNLSQIANGNKEKNGNALMQKSGYNKFFPGSESIQQSNELSKKIAEIFRNMMGERKKAAIEINFHDAAPEILINRLSLPVQNKNVREFLLQAFFTYLFHEKDGHVLNEDFEFISKECSISMDEIKEWMANVSKDLSEKKRCNFIHLSESDSIPSFHCTWCKVKSSKGLSAKDFLHHLSTHICDIVSGVSEHTVANTKEINRIKDIEMTYKGALHFKSLKSSNSGTGFSLTAHVTESQVRPSNSPEIAIIAEQPRKHVDAIDESPIKVSG